jgi:outer membrane protein assembly factor BamB
MRRIASNALPLCLLALFAASAFGQLTVAVGVSCSNAAMKKVESTDGLVQCLVADRAALARLRQAASDAKAEGRFTARIFDGENLPYIDNCVNLLVCDQGMLPQAEIMRVLTPRGVAVVGDKRIEKPRPEELDDWTHYHHNPQGTMVGGDTVVGPPRRLQWMGHPKWLRNHDFMSSMHAMVSCGGRVFYVIDEGLRNHIFLPSDWKLIARDAFNGTILWKRQLKDWHPNNWPLKSGPGDLPRRIVATDDVVYATAGLIEPLTAFDAKTGEVLRTYKGTEATVEIVHCDGTLFLVTSPEMKPVKFRGESTGYGEIGRANSGWAWTADAPQRRVMAVDADSGDILWSHVAKVAPLTLTVSDDEVFYHDGEAVVSLGRTDGKKLWTSAPTPVRSVPTGGSLRLAYADGVAVFARGTGIVALDASSGKTLWKGTLQKTSHHCPEDMFIIDGEIWSPNTGRPQQNGTHFKVFDLHTGVITKDFVAENIKGFPMHPRCYPSRATERFIMTNGMGTEFYELGGNYVDVNNTVRGSCIYGIMPANGLLYKPPDTCACYYQSKLEYLCALAPEAKERTVNEPDAKARLEKGPAYGNVAEAQSIGMDLAWPMYRRDNARSGSTPVAVSHEVKEAWRVELVGKLTQPVVSSGRLFVSAVDQHAVYALDAKTGNVLWQTTVGGRVDSSPTVYRGTVLFGCTDGWVYCLRVTDGAFVWRCLVAPADRQLVAFQQLESVWPVHGSVLINDDMLYCLAGRNMFLDGGVRMAMLNPRTGEELGARRMDENDPATGENLQTLIEAKYMPVANVDILTCNGKNLFMQTQKFDLAGNRLNIAPLQPGRETDDMAGDQHLFCQTGLLDATWYHRSYWIYGNNCGEGWGAYAGPRAKNPAGRIMVLDDDNAYAFRADQLGNMLHPRQSYTLYAAKKQPAVVQTPAEAPKREGKKRRGPKTGIEVRWKIESPSLLVNAMTLGGETLFVAGPPDLADETKMLGYLPGAKDDINRQLRQQDEAWRGEHGGKLWAVSAGTGEKLAEYETDSYPVFDGMIAVGGRLYMSMLDGSVRCYEQ